MSEFQVLSPEEVEEILKVTQDKSNDLSTVLGGNESHDNKEQRKGYVLTNLAEFVRAEWEKALSAFLRKKLIVKTTPFNLSDLAVFTSDKEKLVYTVYRITPNELPGIVIIGMPFLNQAINMLYGGKSNSNDPMMEHPGKVGIIVAEKIAQICLAAFTQACSEYSTINCEILKSSTSPNLITNFSLEDKVYGMELKIYFDEIETIVKFLFIAEFIDQIMPNKVETKHVEKDFWRTAIKSQVVDSMVTVSVTLPDVNMKVKDFIDLKEGDTIPISDPTLVYICLNNLKLFRATAGQANNKRVAKIVSQI